MNILFITSTRLGDAALSTGLLGHLVDSYPGARLTIACGPLAAPLFRAVPGLARLIALEKQPWSLHWLDLWQAVVGTGWDLVVDLRNSPVSRLVRARRRAIFRSDDQTGHKVEQISRLLKLDPPPALRLWFADADRRMAADLVPEGPPTLALAPAANWPGKAWRAERFAEVARRLTAADGILPGGRVAVLGTDAEAAAVRPVLDALERDRTISLVGRTDPLVAAACLARCVLYIGNDSGLTHVAAAVGVPTLGLFGPTPAGLYAPWGPRAAYVAAPPLDPDPAADRRRMDGLDVESVLREAHALWDRQG